MLEEGEGGGGGGKRDGPSVPGGLGGFDFLGCGGVGEGGADGGHAESEGGGGWRDR